LAILALVVMLAVACGDSGGSTADATLDGDPARDLAGEGARDAGSGDGSSETAPVDAAVDTFETFDSSPAPDGLAGDTTVDSGPPPSMMIYFKKPAGWTTVTIHYWQTWPSNKQTSWPGVPMTVVAGGWYRYDLGSEQSAAIVFSDGGKSEQTIDLFRVGGGYFRPTSQTSGKLANGQTVARKLIGRWSDHDPAQHPLLTASPPGGNFYGASLAVELGAATAGATVTARRYTLDGSDPKLAGTTFGDGATLTLGAALAVGQSLTLRLYAQTAAGDSSRSFVFTKRAPSAVEAWKPANKPVSSSQSGRWVYLKDFNSDQGLPARNVTVYLPADYAVKPGRRYRVVYFHDGQNLFQPQEASYGQEWMVDEHYDELIAEDLIHPAIFVGIWSSKDRTKEYVGGCGVGDAKAPYAAWVVHSLKPYIDHHFRTRPEAEFTLTMGSSFGGIISYYLSWNNPDVFSAAACVSTAFKCAGAAMLQDIEAYTGAKKKVRYWIDGGFKEGTALPSGRTSYVENNRRFAEKLAFLGWRDGDDLGFLEADEGHNETAWSRRIKQILYFLLRREAPPATRLQALRTALPSLSVGQSTYVAVDVRLANGPVRTKVYADTFAPATLQALPAGLVTLDPTDGKLTAKGTGTVTLKTTYLGFTATSSLTVK
jgi:predicted alpha/beta superfamily hydrolase